MVGARCSCVQDGPEAQDRYARIPSDLEAVLLPFQREGVLFGLRRGGRVLIADEMGVGKTLQAIALMCCYMVRSPLPAPQVPLGSAAAPQLAPSSRASVVGLAL